MIMKLRSIKLIPVHTPHGEMGNIFYTSSKLEQIQFTGELIRYKNIEELLSKFEILEKVKFEIRNNTVTIKEYKKGRDCW